MSQPCWILQARMKAAVAVRCHTLPSRANQSLHGREESVCIYPTALGMSWDGRELRLPGNLSGWCGMLGWCRALPRAPSATQRPRRRLQRHWGSLFCPGKCPGGLGSGGNKALSLGSLLRNHRIIGWGAFEGHLIQPPSRRRDVFDHIK